MVTDTMKDQHDGVTASPAWRPLDSVLAKDLRTPLVGHSVPHAAYCPS